MQNRFLSLYFRMFFRPESAVSILLQSEKKLLYGFYALLVPALGYTLFYMMAYPAGGAPSSFKPWLNLPMQEYFKYDIFLTFPAYYLGWTASAATVYLVSRLMRGSASFDDTLMVIGFGAGVATWSSMLHDLTDAFLSIIGVIDMQEYERLLNEPTFWRYLLLTLYLIYFFWFISLFTIGIKKANNFDYGISITLAILGLAVYQTVLLIFIR